MRQGMPTGVKILIGIGVGFALALPVLVIEFIIFFVAPGTFKPQSIAAVEDDSIYDASRAGTGTESYDYDDSNSPTYDLDDYYGDIVVLEGDDPRINVFGSGIYRDSDGVWRWGYDEEEGFYEELIDYDTNLEQKSGNQDAAAAESSETAISQETDPSGNSQTLDYTTMTVGETQYEDFEWLRRVIYDNEQISEVFPNGAKGIKTPESLEGEWKCYITDDPAQDYSSGVTRLMYAEIHSTGDTITISLKWWQMIDNDTAEVLDESEYPPAILTGTWTEDGKHIQASGDYLSGDLVQFFEADGKQYGGADVTWQSGEHDTIGFMRP